MRWCSTIPGRWPAVGRVLLAAALPWAALVIAAAPAVSAPAPPGLALAALVIRPGAGLTPHFPIDRSPVDVFSAAYGGRGPKVPCLAPEVWPSLAGCVAR